MTNEVVGKQLRDIRDVLAQLSFSYGDFSSEISDLGILIESLESDLESQSGSFSPELKESIYKRLAYLNDRSKIKPVNLFILERELDSFFLNLSKFYEVSSNNEKMHRFNKEKGLSNRQRAILNLFSAGGQIQLKDISKHFPDITDRTLRFDLADLVSSGHLIQRGFGRGSFYELNNKEK
ncbi:DeoR family transcriptional regulator [Candidatus Parcubacteria bacterium]|nr:MAG: DeoR family transcriptional regulator [Candidatus Parcubacteria bacterium]